MKPTYRVRDWAEHYETTETRRLKTLRWVPVRNQMDGKGYRRVAAHPRNAALFAAFVLILEVASRMPVRGTLADDDGPLDAEDLAAKTGFPREIFELAFEVLSGPGIRWLEELKDGVGGNLRGTAGNSGDCPDEGNGNEPNGQVSAGADSHSRRIAKVPVAAVSVKDSAPAVARPPGDSGGGRNPGESAHEPKHPSGQINDDVSPGELLTDTEHESAINDNPTPDDATQIVEAWNAIEGLPKVLKLTAQRRRILQSRLRNLDWKQHWREAMSRIADSPFCRGEVGGGWRASFDFFLRADTVTKAIEGQYDRTRFGHRGGPAAHVGDAAAAFESIRMAVQRFSTTIDTEHAKAMASLDGQTRTALSAIGGFGRIRGMTEQTRFSVFGAFRGAYEAAMATPHSDPDRRAIASPQGDAAAVRRVVS